VLPCVTIATGILLAVGPAQGRPKDAARRTPSSLKKMADGDSGVVGFDIICDLQKKSFGQRSAEERKEILDDGRPQISVKLSKPHGAKYNRGFSKSWYAKTQWLCGSKEKQALLCWPCVPCQPSQRHGPKQVCTSLRKLQIGYHNALKLRSQTLLTLV